MMKAVQIAAACLLSGAWLSNAASAEAVYPSAISAADTASIDAMAKRTFESIRGGKSADALNQFFGSSGLAKGKTSEFAYLASQIDTVNGIYGPMGECRLAEERIKVGLLVQRLYLCRHSQYMTRWKMLFVNTDSGWKGANLFFDDKVWLGMDEQ